MDNLAWLLRGPVFALHQCWTGEVSPHALLDNKRLETCMLFVGLYVLDACCGPCLSYLLQFLSLQLRKGRGKDNTHMMLSMNDVAFHVLTSAFHSYNAINWASFSAGCLTEGSLQTFSHCWLLIMARFGPRPKVAAMLEAQLPRCIF